MAEGELSEDERHELLRAWPWPEEAATTRGGFGPVCAAVEAIVAARVAAGVEAALTEVVARSEAVAPRETLRLNERRTYWLGANDVLRVVRGYRDNLARREEQRDG